MSNDLNTTTNDQHSDLNADKIVNGANLLAHFNVRCPACNKLFRIAAKEIKSSSPHFDCTACAARFTFDFPPASPYKVETRVISQKDSFQLMDSVDREEQAAAPSLKACPKCEAVNPQMSKECLKCGVIFSRVEELPMDASMGALPSLVKAWQDLMSDYSNMTKHVAFVDRCEDLQALPFALKKYETLKEVQPTDSMAQEMFHRVLIRNLQKKVDRISWLQKTKKFMTLANGKINWPRVRKLAPFALSFALIMVGLSSPAARNMVGMGAALLFLTIGLTLFIKGRISLDDFW